MDIDREYLNSQYHGEQKTLREIGSLIGLSHCTVLRLMRKYEIPTNRTKGPKSKTFTIQCEYCGDNIDRVPSTHGKHSFCSSECYHRWMIGNTCGENNVNWKGGMTAISSNNLKTPQFRNLKKIILACFKSCVMCGENENLHVHHIKTRRESPELSFEKSNLITLCRSCHSHIKCKEKEWEWYFTDVVRLHDDPQIIH